MKRTAITLLLCLSAMLTQAGEQAQEKVLKSLYEYLGAIATSPLETKIGEVDFIMNASAATSDSALVARTVFTWFKESPVMGDEAVALHVYDHWMAGAAKSKDVFLLSAGLWAEINRSSMIGAKAPGLALEAMDGSYVELFGGATASGGNGSDGSGSGVSGVAGGNGSGGSGVSGDNGSGVSGGRPVILWFYDTSCSKCREESPIIAQTDFSEADFYAIYTGSDREAWTAYVKENFPECNFTHLWDPSSTSDKEMKYAVVGTPRMFLVGPDGRIEGRMLDAESASTLLHSVLAANNPYYDLSPVLELYDYVFSSIGDTLTRQDIAMVRSTARRSTIAGGIDTLSYKQMTAGLMQWLLQRTGPAAYEGLLDVCVEDVLAVDVWTGANDTLEVVNPARLFASIRSLCPIGGKLPRFVVKTEGGCKRLSKLKDVYVMFYDPSCSSCKEKLAVYKDRAVFVNIEAQSRRIKKRMLKSIDLSILPMIFKTDSEGVIVERAL